MSKLLSKLHKLIQKSAGSHLVNISIIMSKRSSYHRTPKFKPEFKELKTATKHSATHLRRPEKVQTLNEPIKSAADKKLYKVIRLENGLTALLISDPSKIVEDEEGTDSSSSSDSGSGSDTDGTTASGKSGTSDSHQYAHRRDFDDEKLAACALCVGVGSYSDPPDIQGLAHFVEHMVFMGSEKYPKENEFDSFIKKRGGSDNASTDCEVTTFYFEIQEKHLPHAMDMFSQFYVSPLMKKEAMTREREAIESEFAIAAPSDANRKDQLLSSFFPAGHPARTFTWGNLKSLREDLNDDEKLYNAAHEFRKRHYSAHRMTVAVQARMELSTLENYVVNSFGQIPSNKLPSDDFSPHNFTENIITPEFTSMYYVKPLSDTTELHLTWMFRSLISEYQSKPHQYISYLLGHEGKGSLLSYLRKKVWALGIYTGNSESGIDYTSMYSLFSTQIILTKDGLDNKDKVLAALFSYLEMLRRLGPSERIFEEIKTIEETGFRFEEESQPADYVESLAENMHFYPPEHYITGDRLYYKYDPEAIIGLLNDMTPDKVNILVLSNKHSKPIHYDSKEKWFGTQYAKREIPKPWLESWSKVEPYDEFHIPEKNVYITTNFDLIPPAEPYIAHEKLIGVNLESSSMRSIYDATRDNGNPPQVTFEKDGLGATVKSFRLDQPNLFRKNRHMELWYKPDFKFKFPTALLYFYFITPLSLKSAKDACLLDLWTDVLQQNLKEEVYPANMADLSHSVYVLDKGINLKVNGYNQNIHLLVELIAREMVSTTDSLTESMFEAVREVRARLYHNLLLKPHKLSKDIRMQVLLEPYVSPREKAMSINQVTLDDLQEFHANLFNKMYLQILIQGNMEWSDAIRISENVLKTLNYEPLDTEDMPELVVHELPLGAHTVRVMSLNPASTNSIVTNYYQGGRSTAEDTAVLEILMMLMEEPVFDQLRTKEQLGYSVFSMMRYTFGVLGFTVTVNTQVDKFSVTHVDRRVEAFLKKFARDMRRLNDKTLMATKNSLEQLKHTSDYELKEEVERNWREIQSREYNFNRMFEEAQAIKSIRLSDIKAWVENHFSTGNRADFRKISIQINGHKNQQNSITSMTDDKLNDYRLNYLLANDTEEKETEPITEQFVSDVIEFKKKLPFIKVPPVDLPPC